MERIAILMLLLALVLILLPGCGRVPLVDQAIEQHESAEAVEKKEIDTHVPNFQGIADALGCVFAPQSCQK